LQATVPGKYTTDQLMLSASNLLMHFERDAKQKPSRTADVLRHPEVALYQRITAFDLRLSATKQTFLDRNNSLDLEICPGWNALTSCELRVKAATGGLRLITTEAKLIDSSVEFSSPPDAGLYTFKAIPAGSSTTIRIPYTLEQDSVSRISVRLEASYTTAFGKFFFAKTPSIHIALALGVNVQDVFKHQALFSRFNVSTASASPLKLFKTELLPSDIFEPTFGVPPGRPVVVFPKQPASLCYKISRKEGKIGPKTAKTLYLKVHYSVLRDEIEALVERSLVQELEESPLRIYSQAIVADVLGHVTDNLSAADLEHASLLGEIPTAFLADVSWDAHFSGMGQAPGTQEPAPLAILSFLKDWQKAHPKIIIPDVASTQERRCITIPVEVPSLSVIHTVDIQLQTPLPSPSPIKSTSTPIVSTNQLLPAILRLQWSRVWSTAENEPTEPLEFTYEVTAPPDTWLLGGRRRGRFVVSTEPSETEVPLVLVPLREGWLPYPVIEIRRATDDETTTSHCEVDHRNLGETVRVVADRERVTLSLDASGPGGGPLVLESEQRWHGARIVA
jgi:trafficking protein particle complex subunit 10